MRKPEHHHGFCNDPAVADHIRQGGYVMANGGCRWCGQHLLVVLGGAIICANCDSPKGDPQEWASDMPDELKPPPAWFRPK